MKNNIRDYKGLSDEEKKYLREFDDAIERGYFKNKLVKVPVKMKKEIEKEREEFRRDIMIKCKRKGIEADPTSVDDKPFVGRKKVNSPRDKSGKFVKKDKK